MECYDPKLDQWNAKVSAASCRRTSVGVAVLGDCVYAVGGQDGLTCLSLVERYVPSVPPSPAVTLKTVRYSPSTGKWQQVCQMTKARLGVGVASHGGYLYAVGGSDGVSPLASTERSDPALL